MSRTDSAIVTRQLQAGPTVSTPSSSFRLNSSSWGAAPETFLHRQAILPHEGGDPFLPGGAEVRAEQSHAVLSVMAAMGSKYI